MSDIKEEERVDLSHYDLKDVFSIYEAACLIVGEDPYTLDESDLDRTPLGARVSVIREAMIQACQAALFETNLARAYYAIKPRESVSLPWNVTYDDNAELIPMLPSVNQYRGLYERDTKWEGLSTCDSISRYESFKRSDIVRWLQVSGYTKAHYFQTRQKPTGIPRQSEIDHLKAEVSRLESELAQAKASQPQAMPIPEYLDPSHSRYSYRLAAAVRAWEAVSESGNRGVKAAIESWLRDHAEELGLVYQGKPSDKAIKEVATVANWNTAGGAPKTC